jgi:hypothetical protein
VLSEEARSARSSPFYVATVEKMRDSMGFNFSQILAFKFDENWEGVKMAVWLMREDIRILPLLFTPIYLLIPKEYMQYIRQ